LKPVILEAFENENFIGNTLKRLFEQKGQEYFYFKLKDMNILPCRSCGICSIKTPGKCIVVDDDMPVILKAVASSSMLIMITPIVFGGYSSQLKKAVDKFMLLATPLYSGKGGRLLHLPRYGHKSLLGIGVTKNNSRFQEDSFRKLVAHNALNLQYANSTLVFKPSDETAKIKRDIELALKEGK
jgi:multimeric flavodoxin WrbA